jgi:hypothetical protein
VERLAPVPFAATDQPRARSCASEFFNQKPKVLKKIQAFKL